MRGEVWKKIIAWTTAAACAASVACACALRPSSGTERDPAPESGAVLSVREERGIRLNVERRVHDSLHWYEKDEMGEADEDGNEPTDGEEIFEGEYIVTATVEGEGLDEAQKSVRFWAKFKDPSSDWAKEKDLDRYIRIEAEGNTATIKCHNPFAEQIEVIAESVYIVGVRAVLTLDYKEKVELAGIFVNGTYLGSVSCDHYELEAYKDRSAEIECAFMSSLYTIPADPVTAKIEIKRSEKLAELFPSAEEIFPEYTVTGTFGGEETIHADHFFDETMIQALFLDGFPEQKTQEEIDELYKKLEQMAEEDEPYYRLFAEITYDGEEPIRRELGGFAPNFRQLKEWYETFTNMTVSFGTEGNRITV